MREKNKLILSLLFFVAIIGAIYSFSLLPKQHRDQASGIAPDGLFGWKYPSVKFPITGSGEIAYSDIRDPGGIPEGLPVRLKIPIIGVDSAIEDALITPDGRMDVPSGSVDVAWFALGPHPGQVGSAVIGGHFGIRDGVPFVFYKLDKLVVGDRVYVVDDKGDTISFVVRSIKLFDRDADAATVFTSSDGVVHLNLITCEGIWNKVNGTYPSRRVVFTDRVTETTTVAEPQAGISFPRSLGVGSRGEDVVTLQNILEKKGFLTMPAGVAKGFFGTLTRTAVAKYQKSVGFRADGAFGPLTRAKLAVDLGSNPVLPNTGIQKIANQINVIKSSSFSQDFSSFLKSLYGNKVDGAITTLLIFAIVFVLFKILKKKSNHLTIYKEKE